MTEDRERVNSGQTILNSLLEGDGKGLKDALLSEERSDKRYDLTISLFNDIRRWRLSPSFDPSQMRNVQKTLETVFLLDTKDLPQEFRDYPDPIKSYLKTEVVPFDRDYAEKRNRLLNGSEDPIIKILTDKIGSKGESIQYDHIRFDIDVKANDGEVFKFKISVLSDRDRPQKEIRIFLEQQGIKKETKLDSSIEYGEDDEIESDIYPSSDISYPQPQDQGYGWISPLTVDPKVQEKYDGVEETMVALAMAVAVNEGAKTFFALGVPKENKIFDSLFPEGSPDLLKGEPNLNLTTTYRLDFKNLNQLPQIGIKKR